MQEVLNAYIARQGETPNASLTTDGPLTHYVDLGAPEDDGAWTYDVHATEDRQAIRLYSGDLLWTPRR